jgi:hypothetical protein
MKFKLLAVLAFAGLCAGSLAMAGNSNKMLLADDTSSQTAPAPAVGGSDSTSAGTDSSTATPDNAGSSQDSTPPSDDMNGNTDTGTGDDDY